ncbi:thioredoxin 1 [Weissella beninensis]|uniref:Thioredoxin n=2 Tax=Periweissella beninensis TaxID=504936 RepID=A0ABT0VMD2_9LACO|nr:thioredoxin [Periweissella beninensis]MBM7543954.1 thioredoxin 1 [Periweissella beninensis]MCM2437680.1 thioredoxin [Periweissella beninensis]MCT4396127.1 thioredoxin [Periweissella beninensis]
MKIINDTNLNSSVAEGLTLVDFWADWCAPCKMMNPILEQLAKDYDGQINFGKIDVEKYPHLAENYKVMSIPSLVLFKDGHALEKVSGVYPKGKLTQYLNKKLAEYQN